MPLSSSAFEGESQEHPNPPMSQSHVAWAGQRAEKGQAPEGFVVRNGNSSMAAKHGEMSKQTDAPSHTRAPAKSHSKLGLAPEKANEEKLWIAKVPGLPTTSGMEACEGLCLGSKLRLVPRVTPAGLWKPELCTRPVWRPVLHRAAQTTEGPSGSDA